MSMRKVAVLILMVMMTMSMLGCSESKKNEDKQIRQEQNQAVKQQDEKRKAEMEAQKRQEEQRKAQEQKRQQEENNSKKLASDVALRFTTAFFKEDYESMKGIVYASNKNIETSIQISGMDYARTYIFNHLRRKMNEKGINGSFNYAWSVKVTDYFESKAYFQFEVKIDDVVYVRIKDIEMSKDADGQWYIDMSSFLHQCEYGAWFLL